MMVTGGKSSIGDYFPCGNLVLGEGAHTDIKCLNIFVQAGITLTPLLITLVGKKMQFLQSTIK